MAWVKGWGWVRGEEKGWVKVWGWVRGEEKGWAKGCHPLREGEEVSHTLQARQQKTGA